MEFKDYYAILGLPRDASPADIKKAYRRAARAYHPDANAGDPGAETRFKEANEANAVLSDPDRRATYDALGPDWAARARAQAGPDVSGGAEDGRGRGQTGGARRYRFTGSDVDLGDFSEFFRVFFGTDDLFGSGERFDSNENFGAGGFVSASGRPATGNRAAGLGAVGGLDISLLEAYQGTHRLLALGERRLEVAIPAGIEDGAVIRLAGVAEGSDARLTVHIAPHPDFERHGADLSRALALTLGEALLGAEVIVPTLAGRLALRIPPDTQNGQLFRLRDQGMPRRQGAGHGDLLVRVRVVLPSHLDEATRRAARTFLKRLNQPSPRPDDPPGAPPRRHPRAGGTVPERNRRP